MSKFITIREEYSLPKHHVERGIEVSDAKAAEIQAIIDRKEENSWKEKLGLPWTASGKWVFDFGGRCVCDCPRPKDAYSIVAAMNVLGECFDERGVFIESDARDWTLADKITNLGRRLKSIVE